MFLYHLLLQLTGFLSGKFEIKSFDYQGMFFVIEMLTGMFG